MKRIISVIALITLFAALLCACGKTESSDANAKPLSDIFSEIKDKYEVADMLEISKASDLKNLYGIDANDVDDFAVGINKSGVDQEEIAMIKAVDDDAAARIADLMEKHRQSKLNQMKNYNAEQYEIIDKCSVDTDGKYVSLFISSNADGMKADFKKAIGAD